MIDHFERLGLTRRFSIDSDELEQAYLARSREVHPDFHSLGTAAEQHASLTDTAAVNEAYLTLKDPFRRGEYMLKLLGGPTAAEQKEMPQAFLMEMLDLREEIEQVKVASDPAKLAKMEKDLTARYDAVLARIGAQLGKEPTPANLIAIRKDLNVAKVIRGLLRDL